jgi:hypothetical protein
VRTQHNTTPNKNTDSIITVTLLLLLLLLLLLCNRASEQASRQANERASERKERERLIQLNDMKNHLHHVNNSVTFLLFA